MFTCVSQSDSGCAVVLLLRLFIRRHLQAPIVTIRGCRIDTQYYWDYMNHFSTHTMYYYTLVWVDFVTTSSNLLLKLTGLKGPAWESFDFVLKSTAQVQDYHNILYLYIMRLHNVEFVYTKLLLL